MTHPLPTMDTFLEINSTRSIERPEHKAPLFAFTKIDLIADNYSSTFLHFLCQQSSFLVSSALNICFSSFAIFYKALHVNVNLCSLLNISIIDNDMLCIICYHHYTYHNKLCPCTQVYSSLHLVFPEKLKLLLLL